uniref:Uncharacterized protein n=1 Tax=Anopheles maculatus TaxID=74869 RepID=A0A182S737_9DIPT
MNELEQLEHLSLVSKICTELENHLGLNDKDLAEFIIDLAHKNPTIEAFKRVLVENGAEFSDSFTTNLLRIIQLMKPAGKLGSTAFEDDAKDGKHLAFKFPGLAIPNNKKAYSSDEEVDKEAKDEKKREKYRDRNEDKKAFGTDVVDDMFSELEQMAPSKSSKEEGKSREQLEVDNMFAELENLAPSKTTEEDKEAKRRDRRSQSRERRRDRSRSREKRRDRSRSR